MQDRFRVTARPVVMTARLQGWPQLAVIVDLAVEDDPDVAVLVGHGLMATGHVDDREAPVTESHRPLDPESLAVRPSMPQHVTHALEPRFLHGLGRV